MSKKDTIWIHVEGTAKQVLKADYVKAKTKDLIQFGYTSLSEKEVSDALERALARKGNDVITKFVEADLMLD